MFSNAMLYFELRDVLENMRESIDSRFPTYTKAGWTGLGNARGSEQMEKAILLPDMNFVFLRKGAFLRNWRQTTAQEGRVLPMKALGPEFAFQNTC